MDTVRVELLWRRAHPNLDLVVGQRLPELRRDAQQEAVVAAAQTSSGA